MEDEQIEGAHAEIFAKINSLYASYAALSGRQDVENAVQSIKTALAIGVCKIYSAAHLAKNAKSAIAQLSSNTVPIDEVLALIPSCLAHFADSAACKAGAEFSQYLCTAIRNKISEQEKQALSDKNGGAMLSDANFRLGRKVQKLDEYYRQFGTHDEDSRNWKIASVLEISEDKVVFLKNYWRGTAQSLDAAFSGDESADEHLLSECSLKKNFFPQPETLVQTKETYLLLLQTLKDTWLSERDAASPAAGAAQTTDANLAAGAKQAPNGITPDMLRTLITADVLKKHFPRAKQLHDGKNGVYNEPRRTCSEESAAFINWEALFRSAGFFDDALFKPLFADEHYELPQLQTLAQQAGVTKSAATKRLSRFYERVTARYEKAGGERAFAEHFFQHVSTLSSDDC